MIKFHYTRKTSLLNNEPQEAGVEIQIDNYESQRQEVEDAIEFVDTVADNFFIGGQNERIEVREV